MLMTYLKKFSSIFKRKNKPNYTISIFVFGNKEEQNKLYFQVILENIKKYNYLVTETSYTSLPFNFTVKTSLGDFLVERKGSYLILHVPHQKALNLKKKIDLSPFLKIGLNMVEELFFPEIFTSEISN